MTSLVLRTKDGPGGISGKGVAETKKLTAANLPNDNPTVYSFDLRPITVDVATPGSAITQVGSFSFELRVPLNMVTQTTYENIGFKTPISIREGEKLVVGTTTMKDNGVIVVLSAGVIR